MAQKMTKIKKLVVIVGSAKAGTSSLANWLGQRDELVLGVEKEPRFFLNFDLSKWSGPASDGFVETMISDWSTYDANYPDLHPDQWAIDASTDYIWSEGVDTSLLELSKTCEVKIICIVREPVSRAVSEYNHTLRQGWEDMTFAESLLAEKERRAAGWHPLFYHKRRSEICDDIHRFHMAFADNFLVLDYCDMKTPEVVLDKVSQFLDLPLRPVDTTQSHNVSYLEKNKLSGRLKRSKTLLAIGRVLLPAGLKKRLWNALHVEAKQKATVSDAEKQAYAEIMADEVAACHKSVLVPTEHWK